ncbi:TIGR03087 family PEP-CTERM/XrtA system glycosyltransferase [Qipengyuania sp. DSG2-2]|uniref:TIGR03087 family PEP-CTERM/XrtA system glycosyltransferase n=1 Tax=Qipengyuania sp. DGS2-2 TaxID=3349631 RepID=UPI0036D3DB52
MGDILFLSHRIPFPPDRGDKIRSHHLLRHLAKEHRVHVATFGESAADMAAESELAAVAASHCLIKRSKPLPLAGVEAVLSGKPVSLTAFDHARLHGFLRDTLARHAIDAIFVFSGQMGQYVPADYRGRVVIDLCDVDSAKFEAYGEKGGARAFIDRREGVLLAREEERLAHRADTTILISDNEAALLASRMERPDRARITALRNGIDTVTFDPAKVAVQPELEKTAGPNLVFTGQMDYAPNIDAALRMIDGLMPRIREALPDAVFHCVGRAPVAALTARDGEPGIRIWGEVPDVKPFLKSADMVIAPLTIARGIQNKVLEAMAMARPVILSPEAATGIDAVDGEHFVIAPDDDTIVEAVMGLQANSAEAERLGAEARKFVIQEQGWDAMLAPLSDIVGGAMRDAA